jgi:hypothetical protein
VTSFARLLPLTDHPRSVAARTRTVAAAFVAAFLATLFFAASPAHAIITEVEGVKVGLQPRNGTTLGTPGAEPETFANESGNVVLHGTGDYAIYWDPTKPVEFTPEWVTNLDGFFQALGEAALDTPFGVLPQYRDRSNAVAPFRALLKGSYSDTAKFPAGKCTDPNRHKATCLTDVQLREQLQAFIAAHDLPKGMGTVYFLLTPPNVTICLNKTATRCSDYSVSEEEEEKGERNSVSYKESFCSYHSDINPDGASEGDSNTILYAAIPWTGYVSAYDCQDGGWNPEKHKEAREGKKQLSEAERLKREKELEEDPPEKREEAEKEEALEGPHIQEPNQSTQEGHPYQALTDVLVNQIAVEEMNMVTDPLLTSWHDNKGNEATDLCRNFFASTAGEGESDGEIGGSAAAVKETQAGTLSNVSLGRERYYINNVFSLADDECLGGPGLVARFTAPNPVNAGEIIGVDGMESTFSLWTTGSFGATGPPTPTYATFVWNFGDGTPEVEGYAPGAPICEIPWLSPCAASAFHSYQYGGTYQVTLTMTDVDGNVSRVTHEVTVIGPPPPAPAPAAAGTTSGGSTAAATPGTSPATGEPALPAPVAAAAIVREKLRTALRKGLVVSYSVNEQVAGRFEVLLGSAVAHRLGIGGTPATGLPAGSPPELVIAKAILVTTKAGHSAVHILFSKRTAARLARAHKVSLMLRMVVRNAAKTNPLTTTVLSSITLG